MQPEQTAEVATCTRGQAHENLPFIMICLEKDCARKRLCCLSCIDELHVKHELISLKKFYKYVEDTAYHNLKLNDRDEMLGVITAAQNQVIDNLEKIRTACNYKID